MQSPRQDCLGVIPARCLRMGQIFVPLRGAGRQRAPVGRGAPLLLWMCAESVPWSWGLWPLQWAHRRCGCGPPVPHRHPDLAALGVPLPNPGPPAGAGWNFPGRTSDSPVGCLQPATHVCMGGSGPNLRSCGVRVAPICSRGLEIPVNRPLEWWCRGVIAGSVMGREESSIGGRNLADSTPHELGWRRV